MEFSLQKNLALQDEIVKRMEEKEDKSISYPNYFIRPFHGYDDGNMNWRAVHEAEAATLSKARWILGKCRSIHYTRMDAIEYYKEY